MKKKKLFWWILASLVIVALFVNPSFRAFMDLHREVARLQNRIEFLEQENKQLNEQITRSTSDMEYVEELARRRLGMIRPGEVVYRLK
jgi:cell division protein FtsB